MLSKLNLRTVELEIKRSLLARIKALAKEAFPKETIMYLLGLDAGTKTSLEDLWVPDDVKEFSTTSYILLPSKWRVLAAEAAKERDLTLIGSIHSHPFPAKQSKAARLGTDSWDPTPSEGDLLNADSLGPLLGICMVAETKTGKLRSALRIWGPSIPVEVKLK